MEIAVVMNPKAGGGEDRSAFAAHLKASGFDVIEASDGEATSNIARRLVQKGASVIAAGGGDGTVTTVANAIIDAGAGVALGIIPLGTGNDLARALNLPLDGVAAAEVLKTGTERLIDVVSVRSVKGHTWMLNMATGGTSTATTKNTTTEDKKTFKALSYVLNSWRSLVNRKAFRLTLTVDGQTRRYKAFNIVVANGNSCGGGFNLVPGAKVDDGWLDVVVVRRATLMGIFRMVIKLLFGRLKNDPGLVEARCKQLTIDATPSFALSVDGEVGHRTPISFSMRAGGLRVLTAR